jgi:hypothetical protein
LKNHRVPSGSETTQCILGRTDTWHFTAGWAVGIKPKPVIPAFHIKGNLLLSHIILLLTLTVLYTILHGTVGARVRFPENAMRHKNIREYYTVSHQPEIDMFDSQEPAMLPDITNPGE